MNLIFNPHSYSSFNLPQFNTPHVIPSQTRTLTRKQQSVNSISTQFFHKQTRPAIVNYQIARINQIQCASKPLTKRKDISIRSTYNMNPIIPRLHYFSHDKQLKNVQPTVVSLKMQNRQEMKLNLCFESPSETRPMILKKREGKNNQHSIQISFKSVKSAPSTLLLNDDIQTPQHKHGRTQDRDKTMMVTERMAAIQALMSVAKINETSFQKSLSRVSIDERFFQQ